MTKPVAVFRSVVIGDSRYTVRLDENSHLVLFPTFSRYAPHGRYQPHGQWRHLEVDATGRDRACGWLSVGYHVSGVPRPGRVGHLPALFRGPFHVQPREWDFVRWIGPLE